MSDPAITIAKPVEPPGYFARCGVEFDTAVNVLTGGNLGQTVSLRCAVANRDGKRWGRWACAFLSVVVQRDHCPLQFVAGPSLPWPMCARAWPSRSAWPRSAPWCMRWSSCCNRRAWFAGLRNGCRTEIAGIVLRTRKFIDDQLIRLTHLSVRGLISPPW